MPAAAEGVTGLGFHGNHCFRQASGCRKGKLGRGFRHLNEYSRIFPLPRMPGTLTPFLYSPPKRADEVPQSP